MPIGTSHNMSSSEWRPNFLPEFGHLNKHYNNSNDSIQREQNFKDDFYVLSQFRPLANEEFYSENRKKYSSFGRQSVSVSDTLNQLSIPYSITTQFNKNSNKIAEIPTSQQNLKHYLKLKQNGSNQNNSNSYPGMLNVKNQVSSSNYSQKNSLKHEMTQKNESTINASNDHQYFTGNLLHQPIKQTQQQYIAYLPKKGITQTYINSQGKLANDLWDAEKPLSSLSLENLSESAYTQLEELHAKKLPANTIQKKQQSQQFKTNASNQQQPNGYIKSQNIHKKIKPTANQQRKQLIIAGNTFHLILAFNISYLNNIVSIFP